MQFSKFYKLSNVVVQFAEISMKLDNKSCNSKKKGKRKINTTTKIISP